MRLLTVLTGSLFLFACGDQKTTSPAPAAVVSKKAPPKDESMRFPKKDLVESKIVEDNLMGKSFLPGGNLAHYKRGKQEFDLFLAKAANAEAAALVMFDYKKALSNAKLIPHFGGYFGKDGDRDVFVFAKNAWVAGVAGLPEKDADLIARDFASRIN